MSDVRPEKEANPPAHEEPRGLGGWLILPLMGVALTPVAGLIHLWTYVGLYETWSLLSGFQQAFVISEFIVNAVTMLAVPVVLLVLAYRHSDKFPGLYMIWAVAFPVTIVLDAVAVFQLFRETLEAMGEEMFDEDTTRALGRSIWSALIWVPYMMRSTRVENTFVN